jgi:hypothetical protein
MRMALSKSSAICEHEPLVARVMHWLGAHHWCERGASAVVSALCGCYRYVVACDLARAFNLPIIPYAHRGVRYCKRAVTQPFILAQYRCTLASRALIDRWQAVQSVAMPAGRKCSAESVRFTSSPQHGHCLHEQWHEAPELTALFRALQCDIVYLSGATSP